MAAEWALGRITEALEARTWVKNSVLGIPEVFSFTFLPSFFLPLIARAGRKARGFYVLFGFVLIEKTVVPNLGFQRFNEVSSTCGIRASVKAFGERY